MCFICSLAPDCLGVIRSEVSPADGTHQQQIQKLQ